MKSPEFVDVITEIPIHLPGKIYRSVMPFSSYDLQGKTWSKYQDLRLNLVVILTEHHEYLVHAGKDLPAYYRKRGLLVKHHPIQDYAIPGDEVKFEALISEVIQKLNEGTNVVVHCMAGLGRSGIFLACLAKMHFGWSGRESIKWLREHIPHAIENEKQVNFVIEF
jgi:protein-tyrosine phosphatase